MGKKRCRRCDVCFDPADAKEYLLKEGALIDYECFRVPLCGKCAYEATHFPEEGECELRCEKCGKLFDYAEHRRIFGDHFHHFGKNNLDEFWGNGIICAFCAEEAFTKEICRICGREFDIKDTEETIDKMFGEETYFMYFHYDVCEQCAREELERLGFEHLDEEE